MDNIYQFDFYILYSIELLHTIILKTSGYWLNVAYNHLDYLLNQL